MLSVKLIPCSMAFLLHPSSLWGKCHTGEVFFFSSGKSPEQHSLCNFQCSLSIVTDLALWHNPTSLFYYWVNKTSFCSKNRGPFWKLLKPKREFISWHNWTFQQHSCTQALMCEGAGKILLPANYFPPSPSSSLLSVTFILTQVLLVTPSISPLTCSLPRNDHRTRLFLFSCLLN